MSLPSIDAFTAGKRFRASVAALTKNDMKPKRVPLCVFSNKSLYCLRNSIIGFILTSLYVVNMAAFCCASTRRLAIVARKRVIGTRFSTRSPAATLTLTAGAAGAGAAGAAVAAAAGCAPEFMKFCTSSLVMPPFFPVPGILEASRPCSSINLRAAGPTLSASPAGAESAAGEASAAGAAEPAAPASNTAITSSLRTVSPSPLRISLITPSSGATTSNTTLSVSISTISSSAEHASPGCLCHVATVPSATDSGKVGALISMDMCIP